MSLRCVSSYNEDVNINLDYCLALDFSSYGDTEDEANKILHEAIGIRLNYPRNKNTLDTLFLDLVWTITKKIL